MSDEVYIFDADGVAIEPWGFANALEARFDIKRETTRTFFTTDFQDCLRGVADLRAALVPYLEEWRWPHGVDELIELWFASENRPSAGVMEAIRGFRRAGRVCCLASNQERNRALLIAPGSHLRKPRFRHPGTGNFVAGELSRSYLSNEGFCDADLIKVCAEPGDVTLWHVDTIHGSEMNRSAQERCLYINGYVDARQCMRGHWAFIQGQGVPLPPVDVPVLIHRDDIFDGEIEVEFAKSPMRLVD